MSHRQSPMQRMVAFFLSVSLPEAVQALEVARTLVLTRQAQEAPTRTPRLGRPKATKSSDTESAA